ncbi:MAG: hypothetical protein AB7P03_02840 [Kofleriaceae bacterium]
MSHGTRRTSTCDWLLARKLLTRLRMMKPSLMIVAALSAPAFAQPTSPSAPPPRPMAQPLAVELTIRTSNDVRSHELVLIADPAGRSCSSVKEQAASATDSVRVCAHGDGRAVRLQIECEIIRSGAAIYRATWEAPVVRGSTVEVGRASGARFILAMK